MKKIRQLGHYLWTSLWFVPALLVLAGLVLAIILIELDTRLDAEIWAAWPRLFGAGAAGSRGMLQVIATSMITVAGVVFSITIAALAQASTQYSSRLLRNFMSDRTNQTVLGVFVSIFVYCLVVLRTIRGGDEGAFVPSLAVLGAIVLAFVGIGLLVYFIHHIASSIQASQIVSRVSAETSHAVDNLFPQQLGDEATEDPVQTLSTADAPFHAETVPSRRTGYIQAVDVDALLAIACDLQAVVRMERGIGDFIISDTPLVTLLCHKIAGKPEDSQTAVRLNEAFTVGRQRTINQDADFGIQQIVDVANKALSPGINDTTTAVLCIHHLTAILTQLAHRRIESPCRHKEGSLRVIARGATFPDLLSAAFDQVRRNGEGNVTVLAQLVQALSLLDGTTYSAARRTALLHQAEALHEVIQRSVRAPQERTSLDRECTALIRSLRTIQEDTS
jgi:uncharacterized membrane protein